MYRQLPHYCEGQELALKCVWSVLQVAAEVAHDVFIILYSHLDGTDSGNKTIMDYCKQAHLRSVYHELMEEGYLREYFTVNPKKATYFDLKATRKFMEKIIGEKITSKPMKKILGVMKHLVYSRNDLCHTKIMSLSQEDFISQTQEMCKNLKTLYHLAGEMTANSVGVRAAQELDVIFSSLLGTALASGGMETAGPKSQGLNGIQVKNQLRHHFWTSCDIEKAGGVRKSWSSPEPEVGVEQNQEYDPAVNGKQHNSSISDDKDQLITEGLHQNQDLFVQPQNRSGPESTTLQILSNTAHNSTEEKSTQVDWNEEQEHSKLYHRIKNKSTSKTKNKNKPKYGHQMSNQSGQGKYNLSAPHTQSSNNQPTPTSPSPSPSRSVGAGEGDSNTPTPIIIHEEHHHVIKSPDDVSPQPQFDLVPSEFVFARSSFIRIGRASHLLDKKEDSVLHLIQLIIGIVWLALFVCMRLPAALLYILSKLMCDCIEGIILCILQQRMINLIKLKQSWQANRPPGPLIIHTHFAYQCSRGHTHSFLNIHKRGKVKTLYCIK